MINATWPWKLGGHMYVHEETINFFIMINILWNCDDPYEALHDDCQAGVYWPLACPPPLFQAALPPRLVAIRWCHTQTCPQQAGMSEKGEKSKKLPVVYFPQKICVSFLTIVHLFTVRFLPKHLNSWRKGYFCELCATDSGEKERICLYLVTRASALVGTRNKYT